MGLDLVAVLKRLGVSLDTESAPITPPGIISWLGRLYDVSPQQSKLGISEGMEVWTSGQGFAPLDLVGIETWLFDAPRGDHLVIAERKIGFNIENTPSREDRTLTLWTQNDLAAFIGHAVIDGRLVITDEEVKGELEIEPELFSGQGPFTLKPTNDFSVLEIEGLDISMAKPVLIPAKVHNVKGVLKGPREEEVTRWVLNCGGLFIISKVELLDKSPLLNHANLVVDPDPNFGDLLSERRTYSDGMGDLLRWWIFDNESAVITDYDVLIPAHKGILATGSTWILDGVSGELHLNL
tara:strand:- start:556 stop:1440 length:885 start_codon:yes stop_codon:yes gene_type:complete